MWHRIVNAIIKAFHTIYNNFFLNQEECFQPLSTSSNINFRCGRCVFCNCKRNSMCLKWHNTRRLKKSRYPPTACLRKWHLRCYMTFTYSKSIKFKYLLWNKNKSYHNLSSTKQPFLAYKYLHNPSFRKKFFLPWKYKADTVIQMVVFFTSKF